MENQENESNSGSGTWFADPILGFLRRSNWILSTLGVVRGRSGWVLVGRNPPSVTSRTNCARIDQIQQQIGVWLGYDWFRLDDGCFRLGCIGIDCFKRLSPPQCPAGLFLVGESSVFLRIWINPEKSYRFTINSDNLVLARCRRKNVVFLFKM